MGQTFALWIVLKIILWTSVHSNSNITVSEHRYNEPQGDDAKVSVELSSNSVGLEAVDQKVNFETTIRLFYDLARASARTRKFRVQRHKRAHYTFSKGSRRQISPNGEGQRPPYLSIVKISSGRSWCSGTLVGPKHILTAAHCAFKGSTREKKKKLKVGFVNRRGKIRLRKVRKAHAPEEWFTLATRAEKKVYDYAILELRRPHHRSYLEPVVYHNSRRALHFSGFPKDKTANTMWSTRCPDYNRIKNGDILNQCTLTNGMSGSGLHQIDSDGYYRVKGVLSSDVRYVTRNKRIYTFKFVIVLNHKRKKQICKWIKPRGDRKLCNR